MMANQTRRGARPLLLAALLVVAAGVSGAPARWREQQPAPQAPAAHNTEAMHNNLSHTSSYESCDDSDDGTCPPLARPACPDWAAAPKQQLQGLPGWPRMTDIQWQFQSSGFQLNVLLTHMVIWVGAIVAATAWAHAFDFVLAPLMVRHGLAVRTAPSRIAKPLHEILVSNLVALLASATLPGIAGGLLASSTLWPVDRLYWSVQPLRMLWVVGVTMLVHDAYYYAVHRLLHQHSWLYSRIHAKHHDPDVALEARTGLVITFAEAVLLHGTFHSLAMLAAAALATDPHNINLWVVVIPVLTGVQAGLVGHSGLRYINPLPLLGLNPMLAALMLPGTAHTSQDHQIHHEQARYNLALYFRHWDDLFGTAAPPTDPARARARSSFLIMAYNLAFYAAASWLLANARHLLAGLLSLQGMSLLACAALLPAAPHDGWQWLRSLAVWDHLRQAFACTVSVPHQNPQQQQGTKVVYCYHPHGLLSRGWWLVFALQGKASPVSGTRVHLALHKTVLMPVLKHLLACIGCCSADKDTLRKILSTKTDQPTSVAIVPGGWAEARYTRTNKLLLAKRLGFIKLALETGAHLVPVLGINEQRVGAGSILAAALLLPAKPIPLHVVFGAPLKAAPGEDAASLHSRYVAALLALGKEHGVELSIV